MRGSSAVFGWTGTGIGTIALGLLIKLGNWSKARTGVLGISGLFSPVEEVSERLRLETCREKRLKDSRICPG